MKLVACSRESEAAHTCSLWHFQIGGQSPFDKYAREVHTCVKLVRRPCMWWGSQPLHWVARNCTLWHWCLRCKKTDIHQHQVSEFLMAVFLISSTGYVCYSRNSLLFERLDMAHWNSHLVSHLVPSGTFGWTGGFHLVEQSKFVLRKQIGYKSDHI